MALDGWKHESLKTKINSFTLEYSGGIEDSFRVKLSQLNIIGYIFAYAYSFTLGIGSFSKLYFYHLYINLSLASKKNIYISIYHNTVLFRYMQILVHSICYHS